MPSVKAVHASGITIWEYLVGRNYRGAVKCLQEPVHSCNSFPQLLLRTKYSHCCQDVFPTYSFQRLMTAFYSFLDR